MSHTTSPGQLTTQHKLPYVALSYPKVGLYCSKAESRVPCGWWVVVVVVVVVVQTNNHVKPNFC